MQSYLPQLHTMRSCSFGVSYFSQFMGSNFPGQVARKRKCPYLEEHPYHWIGFKVSAVAASHSTGIPSANTTIETTRHPTPLRPVVLRVCRLRIGLFIMLCWLFLLPRTRSNCPGQEEAPDHVRVLPSFQHPTYQQSTKS